LEEGNEAVCADQVLDGAGTVVASLAANALGGFVDGSALLISQEWGRRFFHELLEAALEGAVTGADDDNVAVLVREDLCFDLACIIPVKHHKAIPATDDADVLNGSGFKKLSNRPATVRVLQQA